IPRIADVSSFGGMVKRYEIQPDPDRLKRYGIIMQQFQSAVSNSNANVGAGYLRQGSIAMNVRGIGLLGRGQDPMQKAMAMSSPYPAVRYLRRQEEERVREIRDIVVVTVNNVPIRVEDLVAGGPSPAHEILAQEGQLPLQAPAERRAEGVK